MFFLVSLVWITRLLVIVNTESVLTEDPEKYVAIIPGQWCPTQKGNAFDFAVSECSRGSVIISAGTQEAFDEEIQNWREAPKRLVPVAIPASKGRSARVLWFYFIHDPLWE